MAESQSDSGHPAKAASTLWHSDGLFDMPVFVTGLPRSGTSMVTGLLGSCGLWLGRTVPGGKENIRGFFENTILRERVQKELLRQGQFDPLGVQRLPPPNWHPVVKNFREVVAQALAAQGYDARQIWGFKDAKLTLTWRLWHEHFPQARWIIVRRPADQVITSCLRTSFMKQHSHDRTFWQVFVAAYLERLELLQRTVGWWRTIEAGDVAASRFDALERLVHDLDLTWRSSAVRAFIAPEQWNRSNSST